MFKVVDDETYKINQESVSSSASEDEDNATSTPDSVDALTEADIEIVDCNYSIQ